MEFYCEMNGSGQWSWVLKTENYETLAVSSQFYRHRQDCLDAIILLQQSTATKSAAKF